MYLLVRDWEGLNNIVFTWQLVCLMLGWYSQRMLVRNHMKRNVLYGINYWRIRYFAFFPRLGDFNLADPNLNWKLIHKHVRAYASIIVAEFILVVLSCIRQSSNLILHQYFMPYGRDIHKGIMMAKFVVGIIPVCFMYSSPSTANTL